MTTTRRYADRTEVATDRSIAEIQRMIRAAGAQQFSYGLDTEHAPPLAWVQFKLRGWMLRFLVKLPNPADPQFTETPTGKSRSAATAAAACEQEERRRWRELVLVLKAKLVGIESGVVAFEEEFLAYAVLPDGRTAGEVLVPEVARTQRGELPSGPIHLLPPGPT